MCSDVHPNSQRRKRSQLARAWVTAMPTKETKIMAIIVTRYHNTPEAFRDFMPLLQEFSVQRDVSALRKGLRALYKKNGKNTYFTGLAGNKKDGRRGKPHNMKFWRAVVSSLEQWWQTAQTTAALLDDPITTPAMIYEDFLRLFPKMPLHGFGYWPKFSWGDIGMWVDKKCDLKQ